MEGTLQKINKYNIPFIDPKNILWKYGPVNTINRGVYRDIPVIIKCYNSSDYYRKNYYYEEVITEIYNYSLVKDSFHCCEIYGYSYNQDDEENNGEYEDHFYLILKDYGVGDIYDYMYQFKFYSSFENEEISDLNYHYELDNDIIMYTLDRDEKVKITLGICDAIEELHSKGIIHCDLKLENMIYEPKEKIVRLIDFGCSCNLKNESRGYSDEGMGTIGYMSEDINEGVITKRGDIYSLGVILIELWVGDIWKGGDNAEDCYDEVIEGLSILRKKESDLAKIIKLCISKEIKERPFISTVKRRIDKNLL